MIDEEKLRFELRQVHACYARGSHGQSEGFRIGVLSAIQKVQEFVGFEACKCWANPDPKYHAGRENSGEAT